MQTGATKDADTILHLQVEDAFSREYWLHLAMRGSATLRSLDDYLRAIWLDCCDHMSKFSVGHPWRGKDVSETQAAKAFRPGVELTHVYDFGTSSYTKIKVVDRGLDSWHGKHPITLLARNDPPPIQCMSCGDPAAVICIECVHDHEAAGGLCVRHAADHPHEDYGAPVPIVNSPRLGMCGYDGPAEPPY